MDERLVRLGQMPPSNQGTQGEVTASSFERRIVPREAINTSERTEKLTALKTEKATHLRAVRENQDLTPEARNKMLSEVSAEHDEKISAAAWEVMDRLDAQIEREYRRAYPVDRPSDDHAAELVREVRRSRIEAEVMEELSNGADGVTMYREAIRLDDTERAVKQLLARRRAELGGLAKLALIDCMIEGVGRTYD